MINQVAPCVIVTAIAIPELLVVLYEVGHSHVMEP